MSEFHSGLKASILTSLPFKRYIIQHYCFPLRSVLLLGGPSFTHPAWRCQPWAAGSTAGSCRPALWSCLSPARWCHSSAPWRASHLDPHHAPGLATSRERENKNHTLACAVQTNMQRYLNMTRAPSLPHTNVYPHSLDVVAMVTRFP